MCRSIGPAYVRRFLDHWRPDLALWVESELWPNLVAEADRAGTPLLLLNGRMSQRSFRGWQRLPGLIGPLLACFELCLAQDDVAGRALRAASAPPRATSVGDLKAAAAPLAGATKASLRASPPMPPTGRSGSPPARMTARRKPPPTRIARCKRERPGLLTIIAPRHPARADDDRGDARTRAASTSRGARAAMRSMPRPTSISPTRSGELGLFYRLAGIAFIGGSLTPIGGHNPLEAALLDCAILHGPDMSNCAAIARALARRRRDHHRRAMRPSLAAAVGPPARRSGRARGARRRRRRRRHATTSAVLDAVMAAHRALARPPRRSCRQPLISGRLSSGRGPASSADLLAPLGWAYGAAGAARRAIDAADARSVPVICVGNLVAGGAGKTPVVLSLAQLLARARHAAAYSEPRLWRQRCTGPLRVDPARHDAREVGDEPLLLAARRADLGRRRPRRLGACRDRRRRRSAAAG